MKRDDLSNDRTLDPVVGWSALTILIALYVVGAVSIPPGSLRHEVQTFPLWFPIVAGLQRRQVAKWAALPCLMFWLAIMVFIWLFLLGWAHVVSGRFSRTEIVLTVIIGAAAVVGAWRALRSPTSLSTIEATGWFLAFATLQILAFWVSLFPYVARR
jgi:hypothetical protein